MVFQTAFYTEENLDRSESVWGNLLSRRSRPRYIMEHVSDKLCALSIVSNVLALEATDSYSRGGMALSGGERCDTSQGS